MMNLGPDTRHCYSADDPQCNWVNNKSTCQALSEGSRKLKVDTRNTPVLMLNQLFIQNARHILASRKPTPLHSTLFTVTAPELWHTLSKSTFQYLFFLSVLSVKVIWDIGISIDHLHLCLSKQYRSLSSGCCHLLWVLRAGMLGYTHRFFLSQLSEF